jgi:4-amino-4-deoxy-L-arabinose transferase-like glycosyltransferase
VYALNILLFGKSAPAMRVMDLLWQLATAAVILRISLDWAGRWRSALLAASLYIAAYYSFHYSTWAQPDGYLNLPMALAVLFCLRANRSDRSIAWGLAAFAVGVAAIFKLTYGLFGVAVLAAAVLRPAEGRSGTVRRLSSLALGVTAAFAICGGYFIAKGTLEDALIAQFRFAPAYVAQIHAAITYRDDLRAVLRPVLIPLLALGLAGLCTGWMLGRRAGHEAALGLLAAWCLVNVVTIVMQGSFLHYHFLPMVPPMALLAGRALEFEPPRSAPRPRPATAALLALAVFLAVAAAKGAQDVHFAWRAMAIGASTDAWRDVGLAIKKVTAPDDRIFVWGNAVAVYIHADRKAACRFIVTAFLAVSAPGTDFRRVCMTELQSHAPKYILLADGPTTPGLPAARVLYEDYPELKQFVSTFYEADTAGPGYTRFRRRPSPGAQ